MPETVKAKYQFAVISLYSWENSGPIVLFRDEDEAKNYLRAIFESEMQSDAENGKHTIAKISENGDYAKLTVLYEGGEEDTTEWILRCNSIYSPAFENQAPLPDKEAQLRAGDFLLPGDKVRVSFPAYRMWGGRCREDPNAPLNDVVGTVLSTTIERNIETQELEFLCEVMAFVPIAGTDNRHYAQAKSFFMNQCKKIEGSEN